MADPSQTSISYANDIRPLFRDKDVESMRRANLDLASYADVSARADAILGRLASGTMPSDGAWPAGDVDLFRRWIDGGKQP
jgi:hypothetical protein